MTSNQSSDQHLGARPVADADAQAPSEISQVTIDCLYPELDADDNHVHIEMASRDGDSLLWLTCRRGITPERAVSSLRKIADLIERQGVGLLKVLEGRDEPLRLNYDENGDIVVKPQRPHD